MDGYTIRRYRALKECPQGQQPGEIFEATEDAGNLLISVGVAELLPDESLHDTEDAGYRRRDQRAKR